MTMQSDQKAQLFGGTTGEQIARRAAALDRIRDLLGEKPHSTLELAAKLELASRTVYGYIAHLKDMGEVYKLDLPDDHGRKLWALNSDEREVSSDRAAAAHARRAWIVPARQMGLQRDPLVAALFGQAPTQPMMTQHGK